ncbi:MAG: 2-isopropylmalate synthase, partial [Chloroflexi bacterium]|nr:2-isopropylmalate synthase [Chloroflexota bacterium]
TATVVEAGADRLFIPDALGVISPHGMHTLVASLRKIASIPIEVHCHNDFGLAVANSIAAVEAGATVVEVIVNGMDPERCGIAPMDEVVMALELLYGVDTGIKTEQLTGLSKLHERLTRMHVAVNKPIVGPRAFNYRVAAEGRQTTEPTRDHFYSSPKVVPFDPALVGNTRVFMLGKYSGLNEVSQQLDALGVTVTDAQLERLVQLVRERGAATKQPIDDEELRHLAQVVAGSSLVPALR